ncbi:MAG: hypothetical protein ABSE46_19940 [Terracidiphilus sp.]
MTHPILSRIPYLRAFVDERFLDHRRRSSSTAGFASLILAAALFEYRLFASRMISWDLLAVITMFAVVKLSLFAWYRFRD